jgi:hypothetical protein
MTQTVPLPANRQEVIRTLMELINAKVSDDFLVRLLQVWQREYKPPIVIDAEV